MLFLSEIRRAQPPDCRDTLIAVRNNHPTRILALRPARRGCGSTDHAPGEAPARAPCARVFLSGHGRVTSPNAGAWLAGYRSLHCATLILTRKLSPDPSLSILSGHAIARC